MSMADSLTDEEIQRFITLPKTITEQERKKMKWKDVNASKRMNIDLSVDSLEHFCVFARVAIDDPLDFSVGLKVIFSDGSKVNVMRCNGVHGAHKNHLEQKNIEDTYHIHIATSRYLQNGFEAESYAENTSTYKSVEGALECLFARCKISYEGHKFS